MSLLNRQSILFIKKLGSIKIVQLMFSFLLITVEFMIHDHLKSYILIKNKKP